MDLKKKHQQYDYIETLLLFMLVLFLHGMASYVHKLYFGSPKRLPSARHPTLIGLFCPSEVSHRIQTYSVLHQCIKVKIQSIRVH